MNIDYELNQLNPHSFEHLVNHLAFQVLGPGLTVFSEGADAGRDGYFQGKAPYPSDVDSWSGVWYIQSKFHEPSLSKDPQKWLLGKIKEEIKDFLDPEKKRVWPDIWIVATNINPSALAETGTFDQAIEVVARANPNLKDRFHIWGGKKIVKLLTKYPHVADYYGHFLTPGNVLSKIFNQIEDRYASEKSIIRHLTASQLDEQKYTKLEQAGSASDDRPGIHDIFIDLPFYNEEHAVSGKAIEWLLKANSRCHRLDDNLPVTEEWMCWNRHPSRAKLWFIKGGPGQGKSTIG